jgi:DnaJ-class molecular chaperone
MDHYSTLGIPRTASPEEIKKAYRKLAMEHHPDRGGDNVKFQELSIAYNTLSDPDKKAAYDNPQAQFGGFNFGPNGFDFQDIFKAFNQQQTNPFEAYVRQQNQQQQMYRTRVTVSLVDAYNGTEQVLKLNTPQGLKVVNLKLPRGVKTGDNMRYDNVVNGAILLIEFVVLSDLRFDRRDDDLYANLPISVLDLIVGTTIQFTTIGKKTLEVTIKPGTQPYMQLKIPGEGMPSRNGGVGDQILLLKPFIPDNIDTDIIESIKRAYQNK